MDLFRVGFSIVAIPLVSDSKLVKEMVGGQFDIVT